MLRGFQIVSDPLIYDALGQCIIEFPNVTGPNGRAAIVAVDYLAPTATADVAGLLNNVAGWQISGRNVAQGDPFPLGLIAGGARPDQLIGAVTDAGRAYFPGQKLPLMDGTRCAGLKLEGRDTIKLILQRVGGAGNNISRVVLHGLEFPKSNRIPLDRQRQIDVLWDQFAAGEGQSYFHGATATLPAGVPFQGSLDSKINPPFSARPRRQEVRGIQVDEVAAVVKEAAFVQSTVQIGAQEQTSHSSQGIPSRAVVGHAHLHITDQVAVDIDPKANSIILLQTPVLAGVNENKARFVALFEGVSNQSVVLCGPGIFS